MYTCPVCGYDGLRRPPVNFLICPSCGTEFGYSDSVASYPQLQADWIADGLRWHSNVTPPPADWNPYEQLRRVGVITRGTATDIRIVDLGANVVDLAFADTFIPSPGARVRIQGPQYGIGRMVTTIIGNTVSNPPIRVNA